MGRRRSHSAASTASSRILSRVRSDSCNQDHWDRNGDDAKGFGDKSITFWGSLCFNLNNSMGPAMVLLPLLNQQAGWLTPTLAISIIWVLSSLSATMLCEAMQRIPGNFNFEHRYEFAPTVLHYFGKRAYALFQVFYNVSLQTTNIAAMIISAQVLDRFLHEVAGRSYALDYEHFPHMRFIESTNDPDFPWCDTGLDEHHRCPDDARLKMVISLGFMIAMVICIPLGYVNLDDNMWFQWFSLVGLLFFTFEFLSQFIMNLGSTDKICLDRDYNCTYEHDNKFGLFSHNGPERTPAINDNVAGQAGVVGIAIFSYAYIVTIPSWINEKRHDVSVKPAIWIPATVSLVLNVATGLLGAWAYQLTMPNGDAREGASDILKILTLHNQPKMTQYSAYLWDITTLLPGMPVLAIMVRYNLMSGGVCGRKASFFYGVVAPWLVAMFCYQQGVLSTFCNWASVIFQGFINFVVPCLLYRAALLRHPDLEQVEDNTRRKAGSIQDDDHLTVPEIYPLLKDADDDEESDEVEQPVNAIPREIHLFGRVFKPNRVLIADIMVGFFSILSLGAIAITIVAEVTGNSVT